MISVSFGYTQQERGRRTEWRSWEWAQAYPSCPHSKTKTASFHQMKKWRDKREGVTKGLERVLFDEICEGEEEEQSDDVSVDGEDEFTDSHVEGSSRDDMKTGVAELQGQHGSVELEPLRYGTRHSLVGDRPDVRHCWWRSRNGKNKKKKKRRWRRRWDGEV